MAHSFYVDCLASAAQSVVAHTLGYRLPFAAPQSGDRAGVEPYAGSIARRLSVSNGSVPAEHVMAVAFASCAALKTMLDDAPSWDSDAFAGDRDDFDSALSGVAGPARRFLAESAKRLATSIVEKSIPAIKRLATEHEAKGILFAEQLRRTIASEPSRHGVEDIGMSVLIGAVERLCFTASAAKGFKLVSGGPRCGILYGSRFAQDALAMLKGGERWQRYRRRLDAGMLTTNRAAMKALATRHSTSLAKITDLLLTGAEVGHETARKILAQHEGNDCFLAVRANRRLAGAVA